MALTEQRVAAYRCPSCGSLARQKEVPYCGASRETVEATTVYDQPDIESVIKTVFNISSTDLAICRVIMTDGEATVKELATQLSFDRSTIYRRLNHLVELGVVEKHPRIPKEGGEVHVYSPAPMDDIHRQFQLGLHTWLTDAEELLDEMHQERLKRMVEEAEAETANEPESQTDEDENGLLMGRLWGWERS